jgi:hypothetical protein
MLRSTLNIFMDDARLLLGSPGIAAASRIKHLRGKVYMDSAYLALHFADGDLVGTAFSLPVYRKASLDNGTYQYYDEAGNLLLTNIV